MANTIHELASVYTYKRDIAKTESQLPKADEKEKAAESLKPLVVIDGHKDFSKKIQQLPQIVSRNLEFSLDEATGQQVVRVIDSNTKELVRQIPSEQMLRIIQQMEEMQDNAVIGVLLDNSV